MLTKRIIPCLDVKEGRVVKGTNFVGLRDAGDPVERAAAYDAEGADELVFLDITATFEERKAMLDVISRTAAKVFYAADSRRRHQQRGGYQKMLCVPVLIKPRSIPQR